MNEDRFFTFQTSLPQEYAEEAYRPVKKRRAVPAVAALAACAVMAALFALPNLPTETADRYDAAETVAETETVADTTFSTAERAAVTEEAAPEETASGVINDGGRKYVGVFRIPEGAKDVAVICGSDDTERRSFRLDGAVWQIGVVATDKTSLSDLADNPFELQSEMTERGEGQVAWCPAEFSYNEGGEGQIFWLDAVPGLFYGLTVDAGASEETLVAMAEKVFVPAQGDVG